MWLQPFIVLIITIAQFIIAEDVGEECTPSNQILDGVCKPVSDCPAALSEIKLKNSHGFYRCGFSGFQEIVCCPETTDKFATEKTNTRLSQRIADRECEKISASALTPLGLHIIGGEEASLGEFPHMVALGFDRGNGYEFDCGGSLLSGSYVLTAAHCVDTLDGISPSIVRAGVVDLGRNTFDSSTDYEIAEIIMHPDYTRKEKYHDLTLLRLDRPVPFLSNLSPICLDTRTQNPSGSLIITGWGKTSNTKNTKSSILLKADVTPVASAKCGESYTNWRKLPDGIARTQLCAGDPNGLKDTCQGDSGGPLVESTPAGEYRLVGVTSFGRGCGSPVPGVYTRVASYLDWIESVVWKN